MKRQPRYLPEFRRQMVELVKAGRTPVELSREFGPTAHSIREWVRSAEGKPSSGSDLTLTEQEELQRLRIEVQQLRIEREILAKAAAWFARETNGGLGKSTDS
jgi:transposase